MKNFSYTGANFQGFSWLVLALVVSVLSQYILMLRAPPYRGVGLPRIQYLNYFRSDLSMGCSSYWLADLLSFGQEKSLYHNRLFNHPKSWNLQLILCYYLSRFYCGAFHLQIENNWRKWNRNWKKKISRDSSVTRSILLCKYLLNSLSKSKSWLFFFLKESSSIILVAIFIAGTVEVTCTLRKSFLIVKLNYLLS